MWTPEHTEFGGEIGRLMNMVDGVLRLVLAAENAMPWIYLVLELAIEIGSYSPATSTQ